VGLALHSVLSSQGCLFSLDDVLSVLDDHNSSSTTTEGAILRKVKQPAVKLPASASKRKQCVIGYFCLYISLYRLQDTSLSLLLHQPDPLLPLYNLRTLPPVACPESGESTLQS
jgi:hypothetical protein